MYNSIIFLRKRAIFLLCVLTCMSGSAGVVHDAGIPFRPVISTAHKRQEPNDSRLSEAHSLGIVIPNNGRYQNKAKSQNGGSKLTNTRIYAKKN